MSRAGWSAVSWALFAVAAIACLAADQRLDGLALDYDEGGNGCRRLTEAGGVEFDATVRPLVAGLIVAAAVPAAWITAGWVCALRGHRMVPVALGGTGEVLSC